MKKIIISFILVGVYNTVFAQNNQQNVSKLQINIEDNKNNEGKKRQTKLVEEIIKLQTEKDEEFKVEQINFLINRMSQYESDLKIWKQLDYWTSPLEFINMGLGDCEDYAITKYYSLLKSGIKEDKLILILTNYQKEKTIEKHVVLGYWQSPIKLWVLDINPKIEYIQDRKELEVLESFNQQGYYYQLTKKKINSIFLQRWNQAKEKSEKEGW